MKKSCAVGSFVFWIVLPLVASYGSGPDELDIPPVPQLDQKIRGTLLAERLKIVSSSPKALALQKESRTTLLAEPRDTLRGLKGVMVFIEEIDADVENHGLTKILLKRKVESRLRQSEIPVLTADEAFNAPGKPYLYLNLTTYNTGIGLYSYSIRIEFNQDVCIIRDLSMKASATTWNADIVGIVGAANLPAVTEDVTALTDKFIRDYLAANQN